MVGENTGDVGTAAGASTESEITAISGEEQSSEVNWSDMALGMESDDVAAESGSGDVEGDAEIVAAPESAVSTVTESPIAPPTPPSTPAAPPPTAADAPPVVSAPAVTAPTQEPPAQPLPSYDEWRANQLTELENQYKFSDDAAAQLITEPEVVLPKLAARLHMDVTERVMKVLQQTLPQVVSQVSDSGRREQEARNSFFAANPDLTDPRYEQAIFHMGRTYRQLNPNAPAGEAVVAIGRMVRSMLGMQAVAEASGAAVGGQPAVGAPVPAAPAVPFTPARGGGGGAVPTPVSNNPWAELAKDFEDD